MATSLKLGALRSIHPRLDLRYAERLRAMYKGGRALLQNPSVMEQVFPRHPLEGEVNYRERCRRAFYDADMAMVINKILAGLSQDPVHFDDGGASVGKKAEPLPDYWVKLQQDARAPADNGPRKTFAQKIEQSVCEGVICGMGWMLCDLPRRPVAEDGTPLVVSRADEELWQSDRAYPVPYRVDQVLDWMDEDGTLMWVKTCDAKDAMRYPGDARGAYMTYTWRIWDAQTITTYQLTLDREGKDRGGVKWDDDSVVQPSEEPVEHTFGMVPWVCFDADVPDEPTLWLADALEGRCRQLFCTGCDDDHLRRVGSYPQLYEYLGAEQGGPDTVIPENQTNPWRASKHMSLRGPDVIQIRGAQDKAGFVEPAMTATAANRAAIAEGRDQIPKIVGMLALMNDTSGALIKRSGESKAQDKISEQVIMGAIGKRALAFARAVAEMLARGRREDVALLPAMKGYENFDTEDASTRIEERVALATSPIKSATFEVEHSVMVAKAILGPSTPPETIGKIRDELESSVTQEQFDEPAVDQMASQGATQDKSLGWD